MAVGEGFDVPVVIVPARDRHADDLFDLAQEFEFVFRAEGNRAAVGSGARRAADAVDVGFRFVRQIVVHHQPDVLHIHAAGGDVGGDEHGSEAFLEAVERLLALGLGLVAVDGIGGKPGGAEALGEFVRAVFGAAEDDGQLLLGGTRPGRAAVAPTAAACCRG